MTLTRRTFATGLLAAGAGAALPPVIAAGQELSTRLVPSTGAQVPAVGLGSWATFNVGRDPVLLDQCTAVMAAFFEDGGGMIDSSPMYGSSQHTIGHALRALGQPPVFSADKVWTPGGGAGPEQIERSRAAWGVQQFDLLQVHNLVDWREHLETLFSMKAEGTLAHVGVTTSHGRRHDLLEKVMREEPLDFVQLTYNILDREAEARLLPLAAERGIAVIVNRPFRRKALIRRFGKHPLPGWAQEIGAASWAQLLLKFILGHPTVTVVIPATTQVDHVRENKAAALGPIPDGAMRQRMANDVAGL